MKNLLVFILLLTSFTSVAQDYKLLPDSCTYCRSRHTLGGSTFYTKYYGLLPGNDTLYLGNNYLKIEFNSYVTLGGQPFAVRQEGNKLKGILFNATQEVLIMDFDAQAGDTVDSLFSDGVYYTAIVETKDSTLINGAYLRWMDLRGISIYNDGAMDWEFRWNERGICNSPTLYGNSANYLYGGILHNLPLEEISISPIYTQPLFCTKDPTLVSSAGLVCDQCQLMTNSIEELSFGKIELVKITDLMGRESEDLPNTALIYIYSNGTTEKVFRIE